MVRHIENLLKMTDVEYIKDYETKNRCTLGAGGAALFAAFPRNEGELISLLSALNSGGFDFKVLGGMSNIVVTDSGFKGVLIFTDSLKGFVVNGTILSLDAGIRLPALYVRLCSLGISGFEELFGIPGTVGGAVFQNAGAFGREISDLLLGVRAFDVKAGEVICLSSGELDFSYRKSAFQKDRSLVILSADFKINYADSDGIRERVTMYRNKRRSLQPRERSLGSTFKRPLSGYAGELIDRAGLKGVCIGGACVSEKHAGFIINIGGCTVYDYTSLADLCKSEVFSKFGIKLEREFEILEY